MKKAIWKFSGLAVLAVALFSMTAPAPRAEAGVGCGQTGTWLTYTEICTIGPSNCIVVCAS